MRTIFAVAALLLAAPLLAACGDDDGGTVTATDPGSTPGTSMPTQIPAAPGRVHTLNIATVMDNGGPELCLGPVAESYPPQCGGPAIAGWDWSQHRGMFESEQDVRWGQFAVTGTWDGETLTYTDAVPAALYDRMVQLEPERPEPAADHTDGELEDIAEKVGELPGAQGAYADRGQVLVDVVYDDGSLQKWADATYGDGVVLVISMLVDQT